MSLYTVCACIAPDWHGHSACREQAALPYATLYSLYSHAVRDSMQAIQHLSGASAVEKAGVGTPSTSAACEMTS